MFALAISLHFLAALIWVGGMFFAHLMLRPAAAELEPAQRLQLMLGVFRRFFPWVWGCIGLLLSSGFWIFLGPFQGKAGLHVHLMSAVGLVMAAIFAFLYFVPYRKMGLAVGEQRWPDAASALGLIRKLILTNLILGLLISTYAVAGRHVQLI
ncbi:MAG: CopD family protein [Gammaproteobacteria bacterium SHHR-1]